jgi:SAM-dependent methyltransferase
MGSHQWARHVEPALHTPALPPPVCPDDLASLEQEDAELRCCHCRRRFPSVAGITDLMPQETLTESSPESRQLDAYSVGFSRRPDRLWKQPLRVLVHKMGNGYLHSWAARTLEQIGKGRSLTLLDAGCGDGILKRYLSKRHTYVGVDFSMRLLLRALRYGPATYFRADLNHLPFSNDSFDAVLSFQALQYVPRPQTVLAHVARILKPKGTLLLTIPNDESIKYRFEGIPEFQSQRFDRKNVAGLFEEYFKDLQLEPRGIWIPIPLVSLHAPGVYPARWALSWTVVGTPRK